MRLLVLAACFLPATVFAQEPAGRTPGQRLSVLVRARDTRDSSQQTRLDVRFEGGLFAGMRPAPGQPGELRLEGEGGVATAPVLLYVGDQAGAVTFTAASGAELELVAPRNAGAAGQLYARGRTVRVVRDSATGHLRAEGTPRAGARPPRR